MIATIHINIEMNNIIPDDDVMNRIVKMMAIAMRIPKRKK